MIKIRRLLSDHHDHPHAKDDQRCKTKKIGWWLWFDHHDHLHAENDQRGKTRPNVIPIRAISKSRHGGGERIHSPDKTYSFLSKKYMWRMITKRENCHEKFILKWKLWLSSLFAAPCVVPHISHGFVSDRASGSSIGDVNFLSVLIKIFWLW